MQRRFQALRRAAVTSPLFLFALLSFAGAQGSPISQKDLATTLRPDRLISIRLIMTGDREATISQYEGTMFRMGPKNEDGLGLTPSVLDSGLVRLDFFRVTKITKEGTLIDEVITYIGGTELSGELPQYVSIDPIYSIQLAGISEAGTDSDVRMNTECPCCVRCGGYEFCGISVQTACGRCSCMNYN